MPYHVLFFLLIKQLNQQAANLTHIHTHTTAMAPRSAAINSAHDGRNYTKGEVNGERQLHYWAQWDAH